MNRNKKVSQQFKNKYREPASYKISIVSREVDKFSSNKLIYSQNGSFSINKSAIYKINNLPSHSNIRTKKDIEDENKTIESKSSVRNEYKKYKIRKIESLLFKSINKEKKKGKFTFLFKEYDKKQINGNKKGKRDEIYAKYRYINDFYYNKKEGFVNSGCTCYFNSFLQILIHIPGLINQLKDYKNKFSENILLEYLLKVADDPSYNNLYNLRRKFAKYNSNYKYYAQEDSQEFGAEFLKALNDELSNSDCIIDKWDFNGFNLKYRNSKISKFKFDKLKAIMDDDDSDFKNETIINFYLYFYESQLIICNNKIVHVNYSGDVDNQLAFNLNDLNKKSKINNISLIDLLKNKYSKENCKLIKLPNVLMITLLRAIINEPLIDSEVIPNKEIDLKDFLDKDFGDYSLCTKYSLYSLNICIGKYKRFGHYYSYILINNEWYKFDDLIVEKVEENEINKDLQYIYGIYYINDEFLKTIE